MLCLAGCGGLGITREDSAMEILELNLFATCQCSPEVSASCKMMGEEEVPKGGRTRAEVSPK